MNYFSGTRLDSSEESSEEVNVIGAVTVNYPYPLWMSFPCIFPFALLEECAHCGLHHGRPGETRV